SLLVPDGSGLIIRTAGSNRTKLEIKRDYEYLIRQWEQVRDLTLSSIAPTTIYEEGSLIKRAIRDLYRRNIDEILVEGDRGYKEAKEYMKMLMPSHAKNVKKYEHSVPLFSKYQVEDHLAAMFNPIAQLKSGGYIVINVTEALVAVDVNSGRATKETSIEDTALKTNLEAADELARQIKLRDLAGLIVIDFIDMEDRKNNLSVERKMKDRLKNDRARTQVGRISIFGLLEMSRQRLRPGMIETSTQPCSHCHGTGITRSDDSMSLAILRELEEEGIKNIYSSLHLQTPVDIANYMLNEKRDRIATIETRYKLSIKIEALNSLISPEYKIERIKGSVIASNQNNTVNPDNQQTYNEEDKTNQEENIEPQNKKEDEIGLEDGQTKRRRRRRRKPKQKLGPNKVQPEVSSSSAQTTLDNGKPTNTEQDIPNATPKDYQESEVEKELEEGKSKRETKPRITSRKTNKETSKTKQSKNKLPALEQEHKSKVKPKAKAKVPSKKPTNAKVKTASVVNIADDKQSGNDKNLTTSNNAAELKNNQKTSKRTGWWNLPKKT
ncbi:MAG: ribonuclease E/G, partial [Paracoccaceae bacterium]|nr:ribonuclease E/G [Paracoccaceae bacterium]